MDYSIFEAGDVALQCGATLPRCRLAYATHGTLSPARDNVIVYPTRYAGTHAENMYLVGSGMALDPDKYFIVIPNMLGNGISSSPSNQPAPLNGPSFPATSQYDNVVLQERMLREVFGIERIALALGWSMGDSRRSSGPRCFRIASSGWPASMAARSPRRTATPSSRARRRR